MKRIHALAISALIFSAALLSGCAGATRLPMRAKGPAGETLQNKHLDLAFLDAPGTQRQEVADRLKTVDTAYANPRLFWGRWSESKWGYWWFVASTNDARGDAKWVWHTHNLLVSFDENGVVRKKAVFDDDKSLWAELHTQLAEAPALDLSQPLQLPMTGRGRLHMITLERDSMLLDPVRARISPFRVSPQAIIRVSHDRADNRFDRATTCHTLHLAEKSPMGKRISFCASPAYVATTFQYLQQYGSPQLRWE